MLGKEKRQGDFFNDYVYGELLPEEDTLLSIARLVDFGFVSLQDPEGEDHGCHPSHSRCGHPLPQGSLTETRSICCVRGEREC